MLSGTVVLTALFTASMVLVVLSVARQISLIAATFRQDHRLQNLRSSRSDPFSLKNGEERETSTRLEQIQASLQNAEDELARRSHEMAVGLAIGLASLLLLGPDLFAAMVLLGLAGALVPATVFNILTRRRLRRAGDQIGSMLSDLSEGTTPRVRV